MTGDLVERLRSLSRRIDETKSMELYPQDAATVSAAVAEIERLRASPPVDDLIEALAPFAKAQVTGFRSAPLGTPPDDLIVYEVDGLASSDFRRARELHDRLKGEGPSGE